MQVVQKFEDLQIINLKIENRNVKNKVFRNISERKRKRGKKCTNMRLNICNI